MRRKPGGGLVSGEMNAENNVGEKEAGDHDMCRGVDGGLGGNG